MRLNRKAALWLLLALLVVLAIAITIAVVLTVSQYDPPALYRNLDAGVYTINTTPRAPGEDGLYRIRFAYNGKEVVYTTDDESLVNYIDTMDVMGLKVSDGKITEVYPAGEVATVVCSSSYIQNIEGNCITVNSSLAMNGSQSQVFRGEKTKVYDVSQGKVVTVLPEGLKPMDGISAFSDGDGNLTHIFINFHPTTTPLYWRISRNFNAKTNMTTREPDENGVYSLDFYSGGKTVTLKCKDVALVNSIDAPPTSESHFGLVVDKDSYITQVVNSSLSQRGLLVCDRYEITAISGDTIETVNKLSGKGETWSGRLTQDCRIYDISPAAGAEGRRAQSVTGLQVGDRITAWSNTLGQIKLVYINNRLVDVPAFFNVSRKYNSETKATSRRPDNEGFYTISLLKEGDTEVTTYKTQDKDLMTAIDKESSRCVGILADEENVIKTVYSAQSLFGQTAWSSGGVVTHCAGTVVTRITYGKPSTASNAVMTPDCQIYNVSTTGEYGAPTRLQPGDYIYAFRQPSDELVLIYVTRRCLGVESLYFNVGRQYDAKNDGTLREPDANGFYTFTMSHLGETVKMKTDNKELADALDRFTPGAVSLRVEGDVILEINDPKYACGGSEVANGYLYQGTNAKGQHVAADPEGKEVAFTMAKDCAVYHIRSGADTLEVGDKITVYTNINGEAQVIFIR